MIAISTRRVLLVEDNQGDVTLIRQCLGDCTTIELIHAPNAVQAHCYLDQKPPFEDAPVPDLILLDLALPIFDGTSVLRGIRETKRLAHLPVVVFSSSMRPADKARCAELGATDYIVKPNDWHNWRVTVRRILRTHLQVWHDE